MLDKIGEYTELYLPGKAIKPLSRDLHNKVQTYELEEEGGLSKIISKLFSGFAKFNT